MAGDIEDIDILVSGGGIAGLIAAAAFGPITARLLKRSTASGSSRSFFNRTMASAAALRASSR